MTNISTIITTEKLTLSYINPNTGNYEQKGILKDSLEYPSILEILATDDEDDIKIQAILDILNPPVPVLELEGLEEVNPNEYHYNGTRLPKVLVKKLETLVGEGVDLTPFTKFMERLSKNPSAASISELYDFLSYRDLPITSDGYFLAYKGVAADYWSLKGNKDTIVEEGEVNAGGKILNTVGSTIRVNRNQVDDDRTKGCSFGLHVGSLNYAKGYGKIMVLVKVDPADAVSVPTDWSFQKLRVSSYTVLADFGQEVRTGSATEDGEPINSEITERVQTREEYIEKVRDYLDQRASEYEDDIMYDWDNIPPISIESVLGAVGGDELRLKDAFQELHTYWEEDGGVVLVFLD